MKTEQKRPKLLFPSRVQEIAKVNHTFNENHIKNETMLFSADYDFARKNGDAITNLFLDNIPEDWKQSKLIIDSRVHMLMEGWSPCIPGWHHDDVPRSSNETQFNTKGQPNYIDLEYYSEHLVFLVNPSVSPTEFLNRDIELKLPKQGEIIYEKWNKKIKQAIDGQALTFPDIVRAQEGSIYRMDYNTFHQGTPAVKNGWRFFIRASRFFNDAALTIPNDSRFQRRTGKNEIRRQVNVYMHDFEKGW